MQTQTQTRPRLDALTGARFLAALMVFLFHISLFGPFLYSGYSGVTFFFLLSGFVLAYAYHDLSPVAGSLIRYYGNRIGRIVPIFWITMLLSVPVAWHEFHGDLHIAAWAAALSAVLLQAWPRNGMITLSFDSPAWTLSVEAFFYLLFPAAIILLRRIRTRRAALYGAGFIFAAYIGVVLTLDAWLGLQQGFQWGYTFPPVRLLDFLIGALLAQAAVTGPTPDATASRAILWSGLAWSAVVLALVEWVPGHLQPVRASVVFIPGYAAVIWGLATAPSSGIARALAQPWLVLLGDASYSFYLLHQLVIRYVHGALLVAHMHIGAALYIVAVLGCLSATLLGSALSYTYVETPLRQAIRRRAAEIAEAREMAVTGRSIPSQAEAS